MCCTNDCLENGCCPLEVKALFFAIWTLVHGVIYLALSFYYLTDPVECPIFASTFLTIISLVHTIAGICLLLGYWKSQRYPFLSGIIMSSIIPYVFLLTIYLPVVQIIFTLTSCMYYRKELAKK